MSNADQSDVPTTPTDHDDGAVAVHGSTKKGVLIGAAGAVLVAAILGGAFALGRSGGGSSAGTTTTTAVPTTQAPTTAAPTSTADTPPELAPSPEPSAPSTTVARPDDVTVLPAGLRCQDLADRGYSYAESVQYWRVNGRPTLMDADSNTIPCETLYSASEVTAYWGVDPAKIDAPHLLEAGLRCADLQAAGYDVYSAFDYFYEWDLPANMDADGNGIPCESVYPNAAEAWYDY